MTHRKDGEKVRINMTIKDYAKKYGYNANAKNCGWRGDAFETGTKEFLGVKNPRVSPAGRADFRRGNKWYEFKHSAGELGNDGEKLVKGSSMVCYAPIIRDNDELAYIDAYVLSRENFLAILENVGLLREKTSTNGQRKITIQTFWVNKSNTPNGKKYFYLVNALEKAVQEGYAMRFTDWLVKGWAL